MKKEEIILVAQLLTAMKDGVKKMNEAETARDNEQVSMIKQEILNFQRKIDEML